MLSPLRGIKVLEFSGLAPGPMCGKILSDFGATVTKIEKPSGELVDGLDANKKSIILDIKQSEGTLIAKKLCVSHDVLIDPFRPGILEKFGLGPSDIMKENPKMIFARLTGYGQSGPFSHVSGHDINYASLSGILSMLGPKEMTPSPPANLLADFAGGAVLCAFGITMALLNRVTTGKGIIVDSSMTEGAAYVGSWLYSSKDNFLWGNKRGENWLDGGVHFYRTFETLDGKHMAVGSIEPKFYSILLDGLGLKQDEIGQISEFEKSKAIFAERFKTKTREEWCKIFDGTDACVTPVLTRDEAPNHEQNCARGSFRQLGSTWLPSPAPRLVDADGTETLLPPLLEYASGRETVEILREFGYTQIEINKLLSNGAVISNRAKL